MEPSNNLLLELHHLLPLTLLNKRRLHTLLRPSPSPSLLWPIPLSRHPRVLIPHSNKVILNLNQDMQPIPIHSKVWYACVCFIISDYFSSKFKPEYLVMLYSVLSA